MVAKLTRLTHKITIQLYLVAESYTIRNSRSRRPVRKLLDTPSYVRGEEGWGGITIEIPCTMKSDCEHSKKVIH
jgi:hypothetical protein